MESQRKRPIPHPPRAMTASDIDAWLLAADKRTSPRSRNQIIASIKAQNSYRWWRLNHDIKWIKRQMKKAGLSPDDWKDLL